MPRATKVCNVIGCTEPAAPRHGRCPDHLTEKRRTAPLSPTAIDARSNRERQRRAAVVATWIEAHGHWCPGWQRPPHPATDLTAAHVTAVADGGHELNGALCRSCNSRQKQTPLESHGGTP
jgi:5-methylcytosine-specific restriction protein A